MRVSSTMMTGNYMNQLNRSYENQTKLMEQSDGSSLHRPSDNAVNYSKYLRFETSLSENTQYQSNVNTAISWMSTSDSAMVSMTDIMKTIVEKTTSAANGTNNTESMDAIGKEMLAEVQELVSLGNTQQGDRYVVCGQSDLVQPFSISSDEQARGLTKTLDDKQKSFFNTADNTGSISQMITLTGSDGNTYYANTLNGKVYTKSFVDSGYKDKIAAGQTTVTDADAVGTLSDTTIASKTFISSNFANTGVIKTGTGVGSNWSGSITVNNSAVTLKFATVAQNIVTYKGDDKYISMVKKNGAVESSSDTVNVTGQDMFGSDLFDDANSGNTRSGTAVLNDLLTVQSKTAAADNNWLSSDGMTLSDNAHATVVKAETKLASRQQVYTQVKSMLATQNTSITSDITDVSSTDVAALAVQLMTAQTIYNMSLSVGSKILPKSLADYLS